MRAELSRYCGLFLHTTPRALLSELALALSTLWSVPGFFNLTRAAVHIVVNALSKKTHILPLRPTRGRAHKNTEVKISNFRAN